MNTCNTNIDPHSVDAFGDPLRVQAKFHSENPIVAVLTNEELLQISWRIELSSLGPRAPTQSERPP